MVLCTLFLTGGGYATEPSSPSRLPCSSKPPLLLQHPKAAGVYSSLRPSLLGSQSPQLSNRERLLSFLLHRGEEEMEVQREDQEFFSAEVGALRIHTHAIAPHPKLPFGHLSSRNPLTAHPADALGCSS